MYNHHLTVVRLVGGTTMEEFVSSVSPKGQVTIPSAMRRRLGVKPKDKVAFRYAEDGVKIVRIESPLAASYQAVPALDPPRTLDEMIEVAREEHAQEAAREGL